MNWFFANRRYKNSGYSDLGKQQIPLIPPYIILVDQTTKVQNLVSYNLNTHILVATTVLSPAVSNPVRVFDINNGPSFPENVQFILTLTNGVFSAVSKPLLKYSLAPLYARNGNLYRAILLSEFQ